MSDIVTSALLRENFPESLFPDGYELIPDLKEIYELQLAYYEYKMLTSQELSENGAFFASVEGKPTRHFELCAGESLYLPEHSSGKRKSFFESNIFRTGYGTHGLFPYRGKFHPQMIKGIINIMGIKSGDTILDPMMGSGTVPVEASLMGIHSIGVDASPFCSFMAKTKVDALFMPLARVEKALNNSDKVFDYFSKKSHSPIKRNTKAKKFNSYESFREEESKYLTSENDSPSLESDETKLTHNLLLLTYLDSVGYAERSKRKSAKELFKGILQRYFFVCEKAQDAISKTGITLGKAQVSTGDARHLEIESESISGVLFSPPYSFAIDYIENDSFHLNFFDVDLSNLRESMIGLRGGRLLMDKYECYKADLGQSLKECARVLKHGCICSIVIGTNSSQLSKIFRVPKDEVQGLHELTAELGAANGLQLVKQIERSIHGMSNTMRKEYIVMLQKT